MFPKTEHGVKGLKAILSLDFDTVVVSQGNVIESDIRSEPEQVFPSYV